MSMMPNQTAIDYQKQALAIQREVGYRQGEATTLGNLGNSYKNMGQYETAIDYHEKALAICREIGDREGEARAFLNMGNAYGLMRQIESAYLSWMKSILIYDSLQIPYQVNKILTETFGNLVDQLGKVTYQMVYQTIFEAQLKEIAAEFGNEAAKRIEQIIAMAANGE